MARYRKKPVVVEAWQVVTGAVVPQWLLDAVATYKVWSGRGEDGRLIMCIATLEGVMRADEGDWIIKGVKGELYPIKDDIFRATYEPAE